MSINSKLKTLVCYKRKVYFLSKKNKFFDLLFSRLFLGINYSTYMDLGFYYKPWNVRKEYLLDDLPYHLRYNPGVTISNHDDKTDLLNKISPYLKRRILAFNKLDFDEFSSFIKGIDSFFYKPADGDSGQGIQKYYISKYKDITELFSIIKDKPKGLLEETIKQHHEMNILCPTLVQTVRFTVFKHIKGPRIIFTTLRTSRRPDAFVDNAYQGGIFANVNKETGRIQTNAFCELSVVKNIEELDPCLFTDEGIKNHPITGTQFKGFQIPDFDKAIDLVLKVSKEVDFYNRRLLGFDIAFSDKGPEIIEVNATRPGMGELWQIACKPTPIKKELDSLLEE